MTVPEHWLHSKRVPLGEVRRQFEDAALSERCQLLEFVRCNTGKIRPQPDPDWLFDEMASYLLQCVMRAPNDAQDGDAASVHSPFEALRELVGWFNWRVRAGELKPIRIRAIVDRMKTMFREGDESIRNRSETGFLEHVLETPANRRYFAHWARDPLLSDSYAAALRWGVAHTQSESTNP